LVSGPLPLLLRAWWRVEFIAAGLFGGSCGEVAVGLLADDFFRLGHHDLTGRPLLHPVALSTGLAAAMVGDLVASRHMAVYAGHVLVVARPDGPGDILSARMLALIRQEHHPLNTWLEFFARSAVVEVAARLERAGQIRVLRTHRLMRDTVTYLPVSQLEAARPRAVLATRLMNGLELDGGYVVLAGLMVATGLDATILDGATPEVHARLRRLINRLPSAFLELFAHTEALVGAAVLAHRT
jgi:hypothetical protein